MNRTLFRAPLVITLLFTLLFTLLGAGCTTQDYAQLAIVGNIAANAGCALVADESAPLRSLGYLDVGLLGDFNGDGYHLYPLVRNQLVERSTAAGELDNISVSGFEVEIMAPGDLAGKLAPGERQFFATAFGGTTRPGEYAAMDGVAIPRSAADKLGAAIKEFDAPGPTVLLRVRAHGLRQSGDVVSGWVNYPVTLCRYCLSPSAPPTCKMDASPAVSTARGCQPWQDGAINCCVHMDSSIECK